MTSQPQPGVISDRSPAEARTIRRIARRAADTMQGVDRVEIQRDLETYCAAQPIRLDLLLAAGDITFAETIVAVRAWARLKRPRDAA